MRFSHVESTAKDLNKQFQMVLIAYPVISVWKQLFLRLMMKVNHKP